MPNRILKESICTSNNLDGLSPEEELFFYRLIVNCDDYGRFDARPTILRAKCFPLKIDKITDRDIEQWLASLVEHQLISTYNVNGGSYLQMITWEDHQQVRAQRSKYPHPDMQEPTPASNRNHLIADDDKSPRNPIQSLSESLSVYGEFQNVTLSDDEYTKLIEKFGETGTGARIEKLSEGIASKGYKYKSHYATILSWDRRDQKEGKSGTNKKHPRQLPERNSYTRPEDYGK